MSVKLLILLTLFITTAVIAKDACKYESLADFRWHNRLVIGQLDNQDRLQLLSNQLAQLKHDIDQRKLLFLLIYQGTLINPMQSKQTFCSQITDAIKQQVARPGLHLIGLDGGTKKRYSLTDFSLDDLFGRIDLMPMRQAEMGRQAEIGHQAEMRQPIKQAAPKMDK